MVNLETERYDVTSHRLRAFLARSNNVPLDILINLDTPDSEGIQCLVVMLFRHIQRCRRLSLISRTYGSSPFAEISGPLIHLAHLRIEGMMLRTSPSSDPCLGIIGPHNLALLERLDLDLNHTDGVEFSDGFANIQTHRLKWLSIRCFQEDWYLDIMAFVSRCKSVEDLSLVLSMPEKPFRIQPFVLDKVTFLSDGCSHPYAMIQTISMPALETLSIFGEYIRSPTKREGALAGVNFPCLCSISFELYEFCDDDVLPLHKLLSANPTIEDIDTIQCSRNCIIIFAMLASLDERGSDVIIPELDQPDLFNKPKGAPHIVVPNLKKLTFYREGYRYGVEPDNQAFMFEQVLCRWESASIKAADWQSYGGQKAETHYLTTLYGDRFCFSGKYPAETGKAPSDADSDEG